MKFSDKTKDDVHEVLMNLNRGRLAVSQAHEQIFDILKQPSISPEGGEGFEPLVKKECIF
jgi:hypothetical protein